MRLDPLACTGVRDSTAYRAISAHYGSRTAERSQVPLMNHIDEGLSILDSLGASRRARRAFCLYPLVQSDAAFQENWAALRAGGLPDAELLLALDYRRAANAYLCTPETDGFTAEDIRRVVGDPELDVVTMLIADKRQNWKDFLAHHVKTHPRSDQLDRYFYNWLTYLDSLWKWKRL